MPFTRIRKENDNNKIQKETDKVTDIKKITEEERSTCAEHCGSFSFKFLFL